ncbi:hypothetical protein SI65_04925 [Aspergillus cristatus]|uniref:tRNA-splicing endonuclease subunit Sen2 n=1 Tax=Aspergillus cristatus TaxID=573508 RepID=A0A1E3BG84_ASPCR|nr:hypothetical protein SI65_04925 [Aspergillus cristatus]
MTSQPPSTPNPAPEVAEAASSKIEPTQENVRPAPARRPRPQRPNYRHIHRFPLPLTVHPLPPLFPHNPLSVISVVLSYLTYLISPPHQELYSAYFDSNTSSVHITDEKTIRALWEMGFFGKGSLSRSEPSWLEREKKRRGQFGGKTSEDVTRERRTERRELKLERARMEKLAIEQRLQAEAAAKENGTASPDVDADSTSNGTASTTEKFSLRKAREAKMLESQQSGEQTQMADSGNASPGRKTVRFSPVVQEKQFISDSTVLQLPESLIDGHKADEESLLKNEEHLQLSNEEALFLAYGLGALQVYDSDQKNTIPTSSLLTLFRQHSYFPPRSPAANLDPDDPFLVSYVVYHHYRSLGWIVRSGVKFGVDYILYNRGPVFSHAEFALVVIPSYDLPYWSETEERRAHAEEKQARSWWWLHCVNRVQAQVRKSLVICYVEVPPPDDAQALGNDIGALLGRYKVRDVTIKRWVPNRSRD